MLLDELVYKYCNIPFTPKMDFYDENGINLGRDFTFSSAKNYLDEYLNFYLKLNDLESVIRLSCLGLFDISNDDRIYRVRHPHQHHYINFKGEERGIEVSKLHEMSDNLLKCFSTLYQANTFEDIFEIIKSEKIHGFGPLAIYDTSVRIGFSRKIYPNNVYLHAGAQKGMSNLERKGFVPSRISERSTVPLNKIPEELKLLNPIQIENFLCLYKDHFDSLESINNHLS
jgi:hypothetical protein